MNSPETANRVASAPAVACAEETRWRRAAAGDIEIFERGYGAGNLVALAGRLAAPGADVLGLVGAALAGAAGHFALLARGPGWACGAVDWVRSIPLFFARVGESWTIDDRAERLRREAGLGPAQIDPDAALSMAMAGYTIDRATLYQGLEMLGPGEAVWLRAGRVPERRRYYAYRPWNVATAERRPAKTEAELRELTLDIVRRMIASLDGRPLVVPLSGGLDSRLIVSAAKHLGFKNLRCFAYGRTGNGEAAASRAVAERLNYRWRFVPLTLAMQRRFFAGASYRDYLEDADSCAAVPFVQDMAAIEAMKRAGYVPRDAVFANGNTGDFISGMHIHKALRAGPCGLDPAARRRRILDALYDKHFALWHSLRTPANRARIEARLSSSIEAAGGMPDADEGDHGVYESAEFRDRQCKYVIGGQRIYEFLGHDWRLPLWDNAYLRFWESATLDEKRGQTLYARMLANANWGGVWRDIPVNRKTVRPLWLVPLRALLKAAHAPLGRERWHRFEKRYLQYFMDITCHSASVPYGRAARDRRGARHAVAWLAEAYLARHDLEMARIP